MTPEPARKPTWLCCAAAVAATLAATLLRIGLIPLIGPSAVPFITYFPAVLFTAWYGGFRPAALAVLLSTLSADYYFVSPARSLWIANTGDLITLLIFVLVGLGTALLSDSQRRAIERADREAARRKHAEEAEREQRRLFQTTLGSIGDAVVSTDSGGRVVFANPIAQALLRFQEAEIVGETLDGVFHILDEFSRARRENPVARVLRESSTVGRANHTTLVARDGAEIPIDYSGAPIRNHHGEITGVVLVFRDVSERRAAEKTLAAQAAELRRRARLLEASPSFVRDLEDRIIHWNPGAEKLYGYPASEAMGHLSHSLLQTEFPIPLEEIRSQLMSRGEWDGELVQKRRDGTRLFVASHWALDRDGEQVTCVLEVNIDITERKRIDEQLRGSAERLRLAMEAGRMGVWEWDVGSGSVKWSRELEAIHGLAPGSFGGTFEDYLSDVHPDDLPMVRQSIAQCLEERTDHDVEYRIVWPDGSVHWIHGKGRLVLDASGNLAGMTGVCMDVTDRKQAELRFHLAVESAPNAMVMADHEGRIILVNSQTEKLFGYARHELMGQGIEILLPHRFRAPHQGYRRGFLASPQSRRMGAGRELYGLRRDGTEFPVEIGLNPIESGHGTWVLSAIVDITERRQREEEVRAAEERFRLLVEGVQDYAIYLLDPQGRVITWNSGAERIVGYPAEEIIGRHFDRFYTEQDRQAGEPERNLQAAITEGHHVEESWRVRKDGSRFWANAVITPLYDVAGRLRGFSNITQDTTERKRLYEQIRYRVEELEALMDAMPALVWLAHDPLCQRITGNRAANELLGVPPGSNVSRASGTGLRVPIQQFKADGTELRPDELPMRRAIASREIVSNVEIEFRRADGRRVHAAGSAAPLFDTENEVRGCVAAFLNISERKRAEEALRNSEERLATMLKYLPVGAGVVDTMGRVVIGNPILRTFLRGGVPSMDDDESKRWRAWDGDGQLLPRHAYPTARALRGEEVVPGIDFLHLNQNGVETWTRVSAVPFREPDGTISGALTLIQDIDAERRAVEALRSSAEELRGSNEALARANEDLERFAFVASHDLQEPLRMITTYVQLLLRRYPGQPDADTAMFVDHIVEGTRRMRDLLRDLLAYTQIGDRRSELPVETVDLNIVVENVKQNLKASIDESGAVITSDRLPLMCACQSHLIPLFQNLIGNAIKYRRGDQPQIHISTRHIDGELRFAVADNGIGIEREYHEEIFAAFKRLHGKRIPGTGIGLAICQRVVERYGGRIWVESEIGKGSTVLFTLPNASVVAHSRQPGAGVN